VLIPEWIYQKPFFEFFKKGMTAEDGDVYDIRNLDFSAGMLGEVSLGSSFEVIEQITGRCKR